MAMEIISFYVNFTFVVTLIAKNQNYEKKGEYSPNPSVPVPQKQYR